jgi:hypothetical protein
MFLIRRYLDENAGGGGGEGGGGDQGSGDGSGNGGTDNKGGGGDGGGGQGSDGDGKGSGGQSNQNKTPDYKTQFEAEKAAREKAEGDRDKIRKTLDTNSNLVGDYRKFLDKARTNPQEAIKEFSEKHGIDFGLKPGEGKPKSGDEDLDADKLDKLMQARDAGLMKAMERKFGKALDRLAEDGMRQKHGDWDALESEREAVRLSAAKGEMSMAELSHLAVKAQKLPEIVKDAESKGYEKCKVDMAKKAGGDHKAGGGASDEGGKEGERVSMNTQEGVQKTLGRLNKFHPR